MKWLIGWLIKLWAGHRHIDKTAEVEEGEEVVAEVEM